MSPEGRRPPRDQARRRGGAIKAARGGRLPGWVREEVVRSTPRQRRDAALRALTEGIEAFSEERFGRALRALREAKSLAPRAATVRELLGLAAYHEERWQEALRELRTFRRLTGDTTHMAVELDCLRALGRDRDVHKTWDRFRELGGGRIADDEARVVYASFLLDQGDLRRAWEVIKPGRLVDNAPESRLRRWFVAARVAAANRDRKAAATLAEAVRRQAPDMPGLNDLQAEIDRLED